MEKVDKVKRRHDLNPKKKKKNDNGGLYYNPFIKINNK